MIPGDFAYAQVRMQARHGQRPDAVTWQRLRASGSLAHFLGVARSTGLRPFLARVGASLTARELERSLALELGAYVREVAAWVPSAWQASVALVGELPGVPFPGAPGRARPAAERAPLVSWRETWRAAWPRVLPGERAALVDLARTIDRHLDAMARSDASVDGWALRGALEVDLTRRFRRDAGRPAAPFCHLALVLLDLERLRGALVRRAVFPGVESEVLWV